MIMNDTLGVSVVIPTLNREEYLSNTVMYMLNQNYEKYEIIIVDQSDQQNQEMLKLAKNFSHKIRYYSDVGFKGLPQARNFGWQNAKYEIVLYIDDDIRAEKDFIKNHAKCYIDEDVVLVGGGIDEQHRGVDDREPSGVFNFWTCTPHRGFASHKDQEIAHIPGGNFSIKKEVIEKVNGVDEYLSLGSAEFEETDLSLRVKKLNKKIIFKADSRLLHLAAATGGCRVLNDIPKYMRGLAHNRALVITRHLKFYHKPTAYLRLLLLGLSYSRSAKSFKPLVATINGLLSGRVSGKRSVKCGNYKITK
jgi:glycosyltransferase involved in cell wall biosynthesis